MQHFTISLALIIFGTLFSVLGLAIGRALYRNIRKEDHQERGKVIQRILVNYVLVQCIGWPFMMAMGWLLYINKIGFTIVQPFATGYLIIIMRFLYNTFRAYIGLSSLIIASCRYSFLVYENQVLRIGIQRMRCLFLASTIGIPVLTSVLNEAINPIETVWFCMFMPQNLHPGIQDGVEKAHEIFCAKNNIENTVESPLYNVTKEHLSLSFLYGVKIFHGLLVFIGTSNIIEGFMYCHTFMYLKR